VSPRGVCADGEDGVWGAGGQIVHSQWRGSRDIEHIGSAHTHRLNHPLRTVYKG